jgi:hypothetical protein
LLTFWYINHKKIKGKQCSDIAWFMLQIIYTTVFRVKQLNCGVNITLFYKHAGVILVIPSERKIGISLSGITFIQSSQ